MQIRDSPVLPRWEAAFVGCSSMLGRSQASAAILLGLVTTQLAGGNEALAKATIVAGSLGGVVGLGWALVRRARMLTGTAIGVRCGVAVFGGMVATAAWTLPMLGVGLFLLGVGGATNLVWHGAVRRREARRGSPLGTVNGEIDSWTAPSVTVLMISVAAFGLWSLHAAFAMVTCLVAASGVIAVWFWQDRPAAEPRLGDELVQVDEATAALDPKTAEKLLDGVLSYLAGARIGALVITHKLPVHPRATRVVVISQGKVIEDGDPRELAADPPSAYARLLAARDRGDASHT